MPAHSSHKAQRSRRPLAALLALLTLGASAVVCAAPPGRVDFSIGKVTARATDGSQRALEKGTDVEVGDTIVTERGRVQIRFTDGGYVSLNPYSEFRIDEYRFEREEQQSSRSFFNLLRGGLRSITGLIGKTRSKNWKLATPVATLGIRGTVFEAQLGNSLTVHVISGSVDLFDTDGNFIRGVEAGEVVTYDEKTGQVTIGGQQVEVPDAETATQLGLPADAASGADVDSTGRPTAQIREEPVIVPPPPPPCCF